MVSWISLGYGVIHYFMTCYRLNNNRLIDNENNHQLLPSFMMRKHNEMKKKEVWYERDRSAGFPGSERLKEAEAELLGVTAMWSPLNTN